MKTIAIFGTGGHSKVVLDIIEKVGDYRVVGFFDDRSSLPSSFMGYPVLGGRTELLLLKKQQPSIKAVVAIGSNNARVEIYNYLKSNEIEMPSLVHPRATIGRDVEIKDGSVLMAGVIVNPSSQIGEAVIINTKASIDHDCKIGNGTHVGPGVTLCGGVSVGEMVLLGVGSQIIPGVTVGDNVVVGAGATVIRDVKSAMTVVGTPAKELSENL